MQLQGQLDTRLNLAPAYQPPVLLDSPTQGQLLSLLCAHWGCELQFGQISLDLSTQTAPQRSGFMSYVKHEMLVGACAECCAA